MYRDKNPKPHAPPPSPKFSLPEPYPYYNTTAQELDRNILSLHLFVCDLMAIDEECTAKCLLHVKPHRAILA